MAVTGTSHALATLLTGQVRKSDPDEDNFHIVSFLPAFNIDVNRVHYDETTLVDGKCEETCIKTAVENLNSRGITNAGHMIPLVESRNATKFVQDLNDRFEWVASSLTGVGRNLLQISGLKTEDQVTISDEYDEYFFSEPVPCVLLQTLKDHGVLNDSVIEIIAKYLKLESSQVKLISAIRIEATDVGGVNSQKLHLDHIEGPGKEVIMAISLRKQQSTRGHVVFSPYPTSTLYFDKSHKHKTNINKQILTSRGNVLYGLKDSIAWFGKTDLKEDDELKLESENYKKSQKSNMKRALSWKKYDEEHNQTEKTHVSQMVDYAHMFDASGLHAGQAIEGDLFRIFLTFTDGSITKTPVSENAQAAWPKLYKSIHTCPPLERCVRTARDALGITNASSKDELPIRSNKQAKRHNRKPNPY